ncbi:MAG: flagellar protein export ATPase FliI [Calditrichia bacterium]
MNPIDAKLDMLFSAIDEFETVKSIGKVEEIIGLLIVSKGPSVAVGDLCYVIPPNSSRKIPVEVVGFRGEQVLSMALGDMTGIAPGSKIESTGTTFSVKVGDQLLGRILDGLGKPMDGKGDIKVGTLKSIYQDPPNPLTRKRIDTPLPTGVRVIDGLLTTGRGQRVGIFAGSGVGKSTLLGMIARNSDADVNVIALVGERGREVREFLEKDLGEDGLKKSVVVIATSDQPSLIRVKSAFVATTIAEYFRNKGKNVVLMMDSLTRIALAQREIGLTIGEPPTTRGYTPSVFALMPKLLERAGNDEFGSITGLYTVLVEGDDMNEPVADTARSILDGHIVLSRKLAAAAHYPAIEVLSSASRVLRDITEKDHQQIVSAVLDMMATFREAEDLINIGAYVKGSNPKIDNAIKYMPRIIQFLRQNIDEYSSYEDTVNQLKNLIT